MKRPSVNPNLIYNISTRDSANAKEDSGSTNSNKEVPAKT